MDGLGTETLTFAGRPVVSDWEIKSNGPSRFVNTNAKRALELVRALDRLGARTPKWTVKVKAYGRSRMTNDLHAVANDQSLDGTNGSIELAFAAPQFFGTLDLGPTLTWITLDGPAIRRIDQLDHVAIVRALTELVANGTHAHRTRANPNLGLPSNLSIPVRLGAGSAPASWFKPDTTPIPSIWQRVDPDSPAWAPDLDDFWTAAGGTSDGTLDLGRSLLPSAAASARFVAALADREAIPSPAEAPTRPALAFNPTAFTMIPGTVTSVSPDGTPTPVGRVPETLLGDWVEDGLHTAPYDGFAVESVAGSSTALLIASRTTNAASRRAIRYEARTADGVVSVSPTGQTTKALERLAYNNRDPEQRTLDARAAFGSEIEGPLHPRIDLEAWMTFEAA